MYIAVSYIGSAYTPGEVIPDDYPAEKLDWLIRAGAVREAAPAPSSPAPQEPSLPDEELPEVEPSGEDEFDEDVDAMEIDVMAGIVKDEPNGAQKPSARKSRSTSGKKAPKGGTTK